MLRSILLWSMLAVAAAEQARTGEEHQARLLEWVDPLAEEVAKALPDPSEDLAPFAPWDYEFSEPPNWGCPLGCTELTQINVRRTYVVREPELAARVEGAAAKSLENATRIAANPADQGLQAAQEKLEREEETLKRSVRRIVAEVRINGEAPIPRGMERGPTRAGTVNGYPVSRFAFTDSSYEPTPAGVRLAIMIGPDTFKNRPVKDNSVMRTEARTAVISVSVQSRTATIAADEARARQLLERIDAAAIAKLLK